MNYKNYKKDTTGLEFAGDAFDRDSMYCSYATASNSGLSCDSAIAIKGDIGTVGTMHSFEAVAAQSTVDDLVSRVEALEKKNYYAPKSDELRAIMKTLRYAREVV